jgi:hypothetical protein
MSVSARNFGKTLSTVHINSKLETRLLTYVTAAGAAGVGLLTLSQPVEAKVVYTPLANVPLTSLTTIDLNGDGVADLSFKLQSTYHGSFQLVYPGAGGGIAIGTLNNQYGALPMPWLTRIGPKQPFQDRSALITGVAGCHSTCLKFGPWQNQTNKFLAIKFLIGAQVHYGWMRLTVGAPLTGYASGYAYEDVPNKPIIAGPTGGPVEKASVAPDWPSSEKFQTLGALARGVDGIAIWRREEEPTAS